jgi:hypothetical protein
VGREAALEGDTDTADSDLTACTETMGIETVTNAHILRYRCR